MGVLNLVEDLNGRSSGVNVVVEVMDILLSKPVQLSDLHEIGCSALKDDFVSVVKLHGCNVENVDEHKYVSLPVFDGVTLHEETHYREVDQEQNRISGGDPPVNTGVILGNLIEPTLNAQRIEGRLLNGSLNTNIRDSEKDTVHHNEGFCS